MLKCCVNVVLPRFLNLFNQIDSSIINSLLTNSPRLLTGFSKYMSDRKGVVKDLFFLVFQDASVHHNLSHSLDIFINFVSPHFSLSLGLAHDFSEGAQRCMIQTDDSELILVPHINILIWKNIHRL